VSKILAAHPARPHKTDYYLGRPDPEFEAKMTEVLWRRIGLPEERPSWGGSGVLSYDENGI